MNQRLPASPDVYRSAGAADDEISLVDLWIVLVEHTWLILGISLAFLLAAAAFGYSKTPVFESRTVIEIGRLGGPQTVQVETPAALVERLRQEYRVDDNSEGKVELPRVEEVTQIKGTDAVSLSVRDYTPEGARAYVNEVTERLLDEHQRLFAQAFAAHSRRLESLTRQLEAFDSQIASVSEHIERLQESSPSQSAILAVEKGNLLAERPILEQQRAELEVGLSEMRSRPTRLIREPTLPAQPVNDRLMLYIALGLVLGLMLGVFAAFFSEFMSRARAEINGRRGSGV